MTWKGIDGRGLTLPQLRVYIDALQFKAWKPSGMTLHNTAAPSLAQWTAQNAAQRIKSLEAYYRDDQGWSAGPHAFVDDNFVWLFTPFTTQGVHSPSWNGTKLGIEMVGDYAHDDDESGRGLKVKRNTVALFAMLHEKLGLDPETIKLHKEDPRTTHDCPGAHIDKAEFIALVQEYMGSAGEHDGSQPLQIAPELRPATPPVRRLGTVNVAATDHLNMRASSSAASPIVAALPKGMAVEIASEAMNGQTKWLRITAAGKTGWVAARFVVVL